MRFLGEMYKYGQFWLAEIPILDVKTQDYTRDEAIKIVADIGVHKSFFRETSEVFKTSEVWVSPRFFWLTIW